MRMAVFGSRALIGDSVREVIRREMESRKASHIVTAGEPDGVCSMARTVARETSCPITLHWLHAKERAAGKYHHRSVAVLSDCDFCLFVHDGKSAGTRNEIKLAVKMNVPHTIETMKPAIHDLDISAAVKALERARE
jgi:hypothetical protein